MDKISRREFLERSILAASVPAVLAFGGATPMRASPNERVSIALIGAGGRGRQHLPSLLSMSDVDVTAISDIDESCAAKAIKIVEEKTGRKPQYYRDFRRLLEDKSVDAVSIATPNHWHTLASIWATL